MRDIIETGNIISTCKVKIDSYEHPRQRATRDKKRNTPTTFKLRELCMVKTLSVPKTREGKELLRWVLKFA